MCVLSVCPMLGIEHSVRQKSPPHLHLQPVCKEPLTGLPALSSSGLPPPTHSSLRGKLTVHRTYRGRSRRFTGIPDTVSPTRAGSIIPERSLCCRSGSFLPRATQGERQMALEPMECSPQVATATCVSLDMSWSRGLCVLRTLCC